MSWNQDCDCGALLFQVIDQHRREFFVMKNVDLARATLGHGFRAYHNDSLVDRAVLRCAARIGVLVKVTGRSFGRVLFASVMITMSVLIRSTPPRAADD